jgi:ABC-type transporter Mla MlaB component
MPDDLPGLYLRVCRLLARRSGSMVRCEVSRITADAVCVDALARLALAARRHGCSIRLQGASRELCELIELLGLSDVLGEPAPVEPEPG